MKLISCYIAGFGKFVGRAFEFSDLTVLKEDNGWGKTTLADFLKCMLYGMDSGRSKAVDSNDRLKYDPWNGNVFGGSLVFSYRDRKYRIERSFGKTPAADAVRVYDENNMQTYEFGDKAERLGDILFGVDRESYQRSVYIPQGAINTGGLPDDMKNRLLVLLGSGRPDDNGAEHAIERLDAAERALRAKRRPAKGKLDELDERLELMTRQKAACDEYAAMSVQTEEELKLLSTEIHACGERLKGLDSSIEQINRQNELATKQELYAELQSQLNALKQESEKLQVFFGEIDPKTVNLAGLQTAITEFYTLKKELSEIEEKLYMAESQARERAEALAQLARLEQTMSSSERKWEQDNVKKERRATREARVRTKGKHTGKLLFLAVFASIFGAAQITVNPIWGYPILTVGLIGLLALFFRVLPPRKRRRKKDDDVELNSMLVYQQAEGELMGLRKKLESFPADLEEQCRTLAAAREEKKTRADGLEKAIGKFLQYFRFDETYDYRVCLTLLKNNMESKDRIMQEISHCEEKLRVLTSGANGQEILGVRENLQEADLERFKAQRKEAEHKKDELLARHAKLLAQAESYLKNSQKGELEAEEVRLKEEKERLEKKLCAIQSAKEFLLRARENMATRYLDPVGKNCEKYLTALGADASTLRFAADGAPLFEENGKLYTIDYYSVGWKELIGFCTRLALVDAVFLKDAPVLILDDPFANLDDRKTDKAKRLVKELSSKYQIVYLTCKKERSL